MALPRKLEKKQAPVSARANTEMELDALERSLEELRTQYEMYFTSLIARTPDALHNQVRRSIVKCRKLPFKQTEHYFKLRSLDHRYQTLNSYWMRVLREKEAGTYSKDIFKAELKEELAKEEQFRQTREGKREDQMRNLFQSYEEALKKSTGHVPKLDFKKFKEELVHKAQALKEQHPDKKIKFAIVNKGGAIQVQVKAS